ALKGDFITRGSHVEAFEKAFADYCGAKHAVAFSSGTAGLMASYYTAKAGSNDRILTTPNTFVSTAGAGVQCGATPVFLDIDRNTGNMS
ncbi:DegT/DnrJ/EryC1/StrS family aminotransferase, partial [Klebsiella pneumoniae]|nr:DegT/DnrJ/EryC1/StrS family aminotransferase [Klebsiella pneumoniae]